MAVGSGVELKEGFKPTKLEAFIYVLGWTAELNDGPLHVYLGEKQSSVTNLKTCIEQDGPNSRQDDDKILEATRMFMPIGTIYSNAGNPAPINGFRGEIGCVTAEPKWSWHVDADATGGLRWFVMNGNGSDMNSESKTIVILVKYYGTWLG